MTDRAIRSILVAGDELVGLSAALAFSRALPQARVTILEVACGETALADLLPTTLPAVGRFHAAIGLNELDLVARGVACHHLGTSFSGLGPRDWIHTFGEVGRGEGAVPFHQLWLRAQRTLPFAHYSAASVIGSLGKFVHPSGDPGSPLSSYSYGLRLHPERYRTALTAASTILPRVAGAIRRIERRQDGGIAAILLEGDRRVEADLYLDCTGPAALLLDEIDPGFEDWSAWLPPCSVSCTWSEGSEPDPLDHVRRGVDGWHLSATVPGAMLDLRLSAAGKGPTLRPGRRPASFAANVLALGDAAIACGPLIGMNLSLAHSAILRAIDLLPGRNMHTLELAEYNRLTVLEHGRVRDALALFEAPAAATPASLARTLSQWRARGRLPFFEEETLDSSSWTQILIGQGILPDATTPLAKGVDTDAAASAMADFAQRLNSLAHDLPPYPSYLAKMGARAA